MVILKFTLFLHFKLANLIQYKANLILEVFISFHWSDFARMGDLLKRSMYGHRKFG